MNKLSASSDRRQATDRRQFGRRWTQVHGWICIDGRPRMSCAVQNFSETGALLQPSTPGKLPRHFVLDIDAIKFRMGCEVMREVGGAIGIRFVPVEEVSKLLAASQTTASTYEKLLALANAEHDMAENAEVMRLRARVAVA